MADSPTVLIAVPAELEAKASLAHLDKGSPTDQARTWIKLGTYLDEAEGADWCEFSAVQCFEKAKQLTDQLEDPALSANTVFGLGQTMFTQGSGYRDPELEKAIQYLENAQSLLQQLGDGASVWKARFYRACALAELLGPRRYAANQEAINELEDLKAQLTPNDDLIFRANLESILGNAYIDRADGNPTENTLLAEKCFRRGLRFFQRLKNPTGIAQSYLDLAVAYNQFGNLGDDKYHKISERFARKALAIEGANLPVVGMTGLITNLVDSMFDIEARNWRERLKQSENLLADGIMQAEFSDPDAEALLRLVRVGILWQASQYRGADRYADIFADLTALEGAFSPQNTAQWWLEWQELRGLYHSFMGNHDQVLDIAEESLRATHSILENADDFAERSLFLSSISLITDLATKAHFDQSGAFEALTFARRTYGTLLGFGDTDAYSASPNTAELYLLNSVAEDFCYVLLAFGDYFSPHTIENIGATFWHQAQEGDHLGLFSGLQDFERTGNADLFAEALSAWIEAFSDKLESVLKDLATAEETELQVFAFGGWCTVPLAALTMPGRPSQQLVDHMALFNGPNQYEPKGPKFKSALHLIHPDLSEGEAEAAMLRRLSQNVETIGTLSEIQSELTSGERYDLIHFTAHGRHDFDYMGDVGLICADGQLLTARWVFENVDLKGGPLVCLAACQTGLMDYQSMPHEVFGLPTAFLKVGASAVLSTLWPVNDSATRLLLEKFYELLKTGTLPTQALQQAQIWLRDLPRAKAPEMSDTIRFTQQGQSAPADDKFPFQHPYYWAGFQLHRA